MNRSCDSEFVKRPIGKPFAATQRPGRHFTVVRVILLWTVSLLLPMTLATADSDRQTKPAEKNVRPLPPGGRVPPALLPPTRLPMPAGKANVLDVSSITVVENGDRVKIDTDSRKGITFEITQQKDGRPVTKKVTAKDSAELKKIDPDVHRIYEKHSKRLKQIQNGQLPPGLPGFFGQRFPFPGFRAPQRPPVPGGFGRGFGVSQKVVNGVRTTEVREPDLKVRIVDDPGKEITVEITRRKDGRDVTEKFKATDAENLKTVSPEASRLYSKHSKDQFQHLFQPRDPRPIPQDRVQQKTELPQK